jgi:hypothetical protein
MSDPERPSFDDFLRAREVDLRESGQTIEARFAAFHEAHPEVYAELAAACRNVMAAGRTHWSIDGAFEVVRYFRYIRPDEAEAFRLNNSFRARYARLLMEREPDLAGLFEMRELRSA